MLSATTYPQKSFRVAHFLFLHFLYQLFTKDYPLLRLNLQTLSTEHQPFTNGLNNLTPLKWLVPLPLKSYQMFFQMVTLNPLSSVMLFVGNGLRPFL